VADADSCRPNGRELGKRVCCSESSICRKMSTWKSSVLFIRVCTPGDEKRIIRSGTRECPEQDRVSLVCYYKVLLHARCAQIKRVAASFLRDCERVRSEWLQVSIVSASHVHMISRRAEKKGTPYLNNNAIFYFYTKEM